MAKPTKKPPRTAPGEEVFRQFAWNVAGAVQAAKTRAGATDAHQPPLKRAPARR